jgi:RNA polymerase sigma factor (sigma-70 family)
MAESGMAELPTTRPSLLVRLRDRQDGLAWRQFVELYGPFLYGYARRQGLQDADAADLSQEVLTAVAGAVGRLEYNPDKGSFRNWLFTIVRRRLSDWKEHQLKVTRGSGDSDVKQFLEQRPHPADSNLGWDAEWERSLFTCACERVRGEVNEATWLAFWRTAVEGQPGKRVAAELGLTMSAVYNARSRVLARLKEAVQALQQTAEENE